MKEHSHEGIVQGITTCVCISALNHSLRATIQSAALHSKSFRDSWMGIDQIVWGWGIWRETLRGERKKGNTRMKEYIYSEHEGIVQGISTCVCISALQPALGQLSSPLALHSKSFRDSWMNIDLIVWDWEVWRRRWGGREGILVWKNNIWKNTHMRE